jgi:tetratricopeptide (TPR) repeat protein
VADSADGNSWRAELRAAVAGGDLGRLKGLADQAREQPPAVQVVLVRALRKHGAGAEAEAVLRRGLARYPADFWLALELSRQLGAAKRWGEAEAIYRVALALRPDSPEVWRQAGYPLEDQGKLDEAVAYHRRALQLDPNYPPSHNNLGIALGKQGKLEEAIACFRRAIELDPKFANAYESLGIALHKQGKREEAIPWFRRSIELAPGHASAHSNLGIALWQQGNLDEAVACYRRAIEVKPDFAAAYNALGAVLWQQGKRDESVASFRRATAIDRDFAEAHGNLGQALRELGRFREALTALETAHRLVSKSSGGRSPFADRVKECRGLVELEDRLPDVLSGSDRPTDAERLEFVRVCGLTQRFAAAAGLSAEAFASQPRLAADLKAQHRYAAACYAAQAGCGRGADAAGMSAAERLRWRRQALTWLRADLADRAGQLAADPAARPLLAQTLRHWQTDPDLAGLRDRAQLLRLSSEERTACDRLWADVAALLRRAQPPN